jgi:hypothetical protein
MFHAAVGFFTECNTIIQWWIGSKGLIFLKLKKHIEVDDDDDDDKH